MSRSTIKYNATIEYPKFRRCMYPAACLGKNGDKAYRGSFGDNIANVSTDATTRVTTVDAHGKTSTKTLFVGNDEGFSNVSACAPGYSNPIGDNVCVTNVRLDLCTQDTLGNA